MVRVPLGAGAGRGFTEGASVLVGGTTAEDVARVSDTVITATVPARLTPGAYAVIVTVDAGVSATLADAFEVTPSPRACSSEAGGCAADAAGASGGLPILVALWGIWVARRRACGREDRAARRP